MPTTLDDIHPDIIQTQIFPLLDGRSLSTIAIVSSNLHTLCSDRNLWSDICKCTWPSITHPHVNAIISTFPNAHKSFFHDSFPSLTTQINHRNTSCCYFDNSIHPLPSQLISAVDIRYQSDVIYSKVHFTDITSDFLSSDLRIELNQDVDAISKEFACVEESTWHMQNSLTLNWIMIDPTLKRACNLSSIKPFTIKKDWVSNETRIHYDIVLPGCDRNEVVQCRIQVVLGVGVGGKKLHVREVVMKLTNIDSGCVNGGEFLIVYQRAIMEENNVRRKVVVDDEEMWRSRLEFKEMKRKKRELGKKEHEKWDSDIVINYIGILVSFCFSVYFLSLILD